MELRLKRKPSSGLVLNMELLPRAIYLLALVTERQGHRAAPTELLEIPIYHRALAMERLVAVMELQAAAMEHLVAVMEHLAAIMERPAAVTERQVVLMGHQAQRTELLLAKEVMNIR